MRGRGAPAKKDKIYHSTLAGTPEGIRLRFTSDVKESKFADSSGYIFAEGEDGTDIMFIIENDDVRGVIEEVPQKQWVTIKGEGKGAGAWLVIEDDAGPVMPQKPAQKQSRPPEQNDGDWESLVDDVTLLTVRAAEGLRSGGIPVDGEATAKLWSTLFIAIDKRL